MDAWQRLSDEQGEQLIEQKARSRDREKILTSQLDKCREKICELTSGTDGDQGDPEAVGACVGGAPGTARARRASALERGQRPATAEPGMCGREAWIER